MRAGYPDPDLERARAAGDAVRAAGGSAMDAALKEIEVAFDETARQRSEAERRKRIVAFCSQPCCMFLGECCGCCGRK